MGSFAAGAGTSYLLSSTAPVPSGTANGVLYLNGSKVVTSGSALTFDGTNFTTTGYAAGNGIRSLGGNPVRFYNSANSNWSQISAPVGTGDMQFDTGAGEQMRLTNTGLGIGTSSPGYKLDVQGDVRINGGNQLRFFRPDNSTQGLSIYSGASNNFIQAPVGAIIVDGTNSITFDVTGAVTWRNSGGVSERMRLDASGNLGIGTSSPGAKLDVNGNINVISSARIGYLAQTDTGTVAGVTIPSYGIGWGAFTGFSGTGVGVFGYYGVILGTNNTERLRLKNTGQLRFVPLSSDPAGAEAGDVYYNSSTNKLRVYNGTAWVDLH